MYLLIARVARARPMLDEELDCPTPPKRPPTVVVMPSERIPLLILENSGLFQSRSPAFWQIDMSPTFLSEEQMVATMNGMSKAGLKLTPKYERSGMAKSGAVSNAWYVELLMMPSAAERMYPEAMPISAGNNLPIPFPQMLNERMIAKVTMATRLSFLAVTGSVVPTDCPARPEKWIHGGCSFLDGGI